MNRTTATCIAGMRSKTTTGIKTRFQRPKKPRGRSLLRRQDRVGEAFYAVSAWASSPRDCDGD